MGNSHDRNWGILTIVDIASGAAASLCEGREETLTLTRLGIRGNLTRTLQSTNPIEWIIPDHTRTAAAKFYDGRDNLQEGTG